MRKLVSVIPDSTYMRESLLYAGPPYPSFEFLPYRLQYLCRQYWMDTKSGREVGQQRGYFRGLEQQPYSVTRIHERLGNRWQLWMSNTVMEVHSHLAHIATAKGIVVVCGLGLGMVAYAIAMKSEVEKVYVIERNKFLQYHFPRMLTHLPDVWCEKVEILTGDVLKDSFKLPPVDFMYCDTWAELGSRDAIAMTRTSHDCLLQGQRPKTVGMWGQEQEYTHFCAQNDLDYADENSWNRFVFDLGIPFIWGLPTWEEYFDTVRASALAMAAIALSERKWVDG